MGGWGQGGGVRVLRAVRGEAGLRFPFHAATLLGLAPLFHRLPARDALAAVQTDFFLGRDVWWEGLLNIPVPIKVRRALSVGRAVPAET